MNIDLAFPVIGTALSVGLLAVLLYRRTYLTLPAFFCYQAYCTCASAAGWIVYSRFPRVELYFYLVDLILDTVLYLLVFVELGKSLSRYNRSSAARSALAVLLFLLASSLAWAVAKGAIPPRFPLIWQFASRTMQACAAIEVGAVLALVWWSSVRKFRWPFRELQLASGLGCYSLVALGVAFAHAHGLYRPQDHWLDRLPPGCYLLVLVWWIRYFWFGHDDALPLKSALQGAWPANSGSPDFKGSRDNERQSKWPETAAQDRNERRDSAHITLGH